MNKKNLPSPAALLTLRIATCTAGFALAVTSTLRAADLTWTGVTDGNWDTTTANWSGASTVFTSGDNANFSGTPTNNVTAASGLTIGSINLDGTFTGIVALTGANTVTGTTTVSAGTLNLGDSGALGTSTVTLSGGALKNTAGITVANNIVLGSGTSTIALGTGANMSVTGTLSGSGNLNLGGSGPLSSIYLNFSSNTASGTITIPNAGNNNTVVRIESGNATSASADWVIGGPSDRGTSLDVAGTYSFGSLAGTGYIEGNNLSGTATVSIGANNHSATFSGVIADSHNSTAGMKLAVTKEGTGTETLSGSNTYTGATTINAGTLAIGKASAISSSSAMVLNGGTFATGGFSQTLNTLTLSSTSSIDFGAGASALVFADSSAIAWTGSLDLVNFDIGTDSLQFGTSSTALTTAQLSEISLSGYTASLDSSGVVTFTAVPEPGTMALCVIGLSGVLFIARRKRHLV